MASLCHLCFHVSNVFLFSLPSTLSFFSRKETPVFRFSLLLFFRRLQNASLGWMDVVWLCLKLSRNPPCVFSFFLFFKFVFFLFPLRSRYVYTQASAFFFLFVCEFSPFSMSSFLVLPSLSSPFALSFHGTYAFHMRLCNCAFFSPPPFRSFSSFCFLCFASTRARKQERKKKSGLASENQEEREKRKKRNENAKSSAHWAYFF